MKMYFRKYIFTLFILHILHVSTDLKKDMGHTHHPSWYKALMIQLSFTIVNWLTIFLSFFGLLLYSAAGYTTNNNYYVDPPVDEPPFVDEQQTV